MSAKKCHKQYLQYLSQVKHKKKKNNVSYSFVNNFQQSDTCLPHTRVQVGLLHEAVLLSQPGNF